MLLSGCLLGSPRKSIKCCLLKLPLSHHDEQCQVHTQQPMQMSSLAIFLMQFHGQPQVLSNNPAPSLASWWFCQSQTQPVVDNYTRKKKLFKKILPICEIVRQNLTMLFSFSAMNELGYVCWGGWISGSLIKDNTREGRMFESLGDMAESLGLQKNHLSLGFPHG